MINTVNPCENCSTVRDVNEAGYKVFTFRNPYLGNTCVPFLHWACDYNCAKDIEIPGKIYLRLGFESGPQRIRYLATAQWSK